MRVPVNADIEDVARFMAVRWLKRSPKIIIPIVTGLTHFKPWKNQKQLNKFKRGLIKVLFTTKNFIYFFFLFIVIIISIRRHTLLICGI